jgi:hypothetical protein
MISIRHLAVAVAMSFASFATQPASAATVRYEAESTGAVKDKDDAVGYDSINGVVGRGPDASASNGELLYTLGTNRKIKIVFAGTGVDLIAPLTGDGSTFNWTLNEGAQTGVGTTKGAGGAQSVIPIISGLPNSLHTLEIEKATPSDAENFVLRMDAFDVHNNGQRTRIEQNDPSITYTDWNTTFDNGGDNGIEASGGSLGWTINEGSSASLDFVGTSVAAIVALRTDGRVFNYSIDGGAVTGSIDTSATAMALGGGFWQRYPYLLANDLPHGPHTLTITAGTGAVGGNFIGFLDAIDVYSPVPEPSTLIAAGLALVASAGSRRRRA